jgi:DNA topoisomerase VI subunit B
MSSKAKKSTGGNNNKSQTNNNNKAGAIKKRGTAAGKGSSAGKGEVQVQKSPAEFFAENQAIAGFDNAGKSLFTSIRELVENSLDAAESIMELPEICIQIREFTTHEFNEWRDANDHPISSPRKGGKKKVDVDQDLFQKRKKSGGTAATSAAAAAKEAEKKGVKGGAGTDQPAADETTEKKTTARKKPQQEGYFLISVQDNGCGMAHHAIPDLLGRVLSGSKYGVRQTRGKFGLGAKMALIWSKKSTGFPITIITSHRPTASSPVPSKVSTCSLDIDIYKNEPVILEHSHRSNNATHDTPPWIGTKMELVIMGNWTTYKARILSYLQQLASTYRRLSKDCIKFACICCSTHTLFFFWTILLE